MWSARRGAVCGRDLARSLQAQVEKIKRSSAPCNCVPRFPICSSASCNCSATAPRFSHLLFISFVELQCNCTPIFLFYHQLRGNLLPSNLRCVPKKEKKKKYNNGHVPDIVQPGASAWGTDWIGETKVPSPLGARSGQRSVRACRAPSRLWQHRGVAAPRDPWLPRPRPAAARGRAHRPPPPP